MLTYYVISIIFSITVNIISYYICKWLDRTFLSN